jgi:hypothetical protein
MSPVRKASSVEGLRKAAAAAPVPDDEPRARVTLNLPASMMQDIETWATDAARTLVVPRVGVQDALRAMIRACLTDQQAGSAALAEVRKR